MTVVFQGIPYGRSRTILKIVTLTMQWKVLILKFLCTCLEIGEINIKFRLIKKLSSQKKRKKAFSRHRAEALVLTVCTSIQILTAHEDDGRNYHFQGGGDKRAGVNTTEGVVVPTTIRLHSSPYLFYIPHPFIDSWSGLAVDRIFRLFRSLSLLFG